MLRKLDPKQSYDWISVIIFCASNWDCGHLSALIIHYIMFV